MINWDPGTLATLAAVLLTPAVTAIVRALRGPSNLQDQMQERRSVTKAAIESRVLIPGVADVVAALQPGLEGVAEPELAARAADELSSVDLNRRLISLEMGFVDRSLCTSVQDEILRWLRWQGWSAVAYFPAAVYVAAYVSTGGLQVDRAVNEIAGSVIVGAIAVCGVALTQEIRARNLLATVQRKYE